ncbi:capsid cement protein [Limnobacter sp.]|uniref:capsid cement protein n=1 Tax=Limnobacter sp. TaxID=2003368 RepID=UPI0025B853F5|nr:capsid cement protein [Limnobacter sp.]
MLSPIAGQNGLEFLTQDCIMEAETAVAVGEVMAVDISQITAAGGLPAMDEPVAAADDADSVDTGIFGVALEAGAAGEKVRFRFAGVVDVLAAGSAGLTVGALLSVNVSGQVTAGAAANKAVAIACEALSSGTGTIKVVFNGLAGFGGPTA